MQVPFLMRRVMIADDHPVFRHGLRALLEAQPDLQVVGEAADGLQALELARELKPDVLLLDLIMPGQEGLEILRELAESSLPTLTIVLAAAIGKPQIVEVLRLGARGVILKDTATELVVKAIHTVLAGEFWVGRGDVTNLIEYLRWVLPGSVAPTEPRAFGLTPREREVVVAIVAGYTNRGIAQRLRVSEETIKHHLTHIYDKLGVSNRLELAIFSFHHGLAGSS